MSPGEVEEDDDVRTISLGIKLVLMSEMSQDLLRPDCALSVRRQHPPAASPLHGMKETRYHTDTASPEPEGYCRFAEHVRRVTGAPRESLVLRRWSEQAG